LYVNSLHIEDTHRVAPFFGLLPCVSHFSV
jgi:hypothetical protein